MDIHARQWYPYANGSATIYMSLKARATEGSGIWQSLSYYVPAAANMNLVYSGGNQYGEPIATIRERIVQYLMNSGISDWYSPNTGTVEEALKDAMLGWVMGSGYTDHWLTVFFDGQFGSVYVG